MKKLLNQQEIEIGMMWLIMNNRVGLKGLGIIPNKTFKT